MKRTILILLLVISTVSFAKKVKFAVDMTGQIVNITGVHVTGDFQNIAGFPFGDWQSNTTLMTLEDPATQIYSVVVDIPAFAKYEYKFVNGDQFYEAEFVPVESRVGYDFNDNRWIYVDSLSNDTTTTGPILFAGNAPAGKNLVRLLVDLQNETSVSSNGIHVAGDFQSWDTQRTILYSFVPSIYEVIAFVTPGIYEYKYYNGNSTLDAEVVPAGCTINSNRQVSVPKDTVLAATCYSQCSGCIVTSVRSESRTAFNVYPNPSVSGSITIASENIRTVLVLNSAGEEIKSSEVTSPYYFMDTAGFAEGVYFIKAIANDGTYAIRKLIVQ
jgi:hypothetical protein